MSVMVDWLTVDLPDPVGLPVNAGQVMRVDRQGVVEWVSPARLSVEGSWSSQMTFRASGASAADDGEHRAVWELRAASGNGESKPPLLQISGNPAKFLNGHNLFGSADVGELLRASVMKAKDAIWPDLFAEPELAVGDALISRIDLTGSWLLERDSDVLPVLRAMEETVWCPYRGRGVFDAGGSTLYYGRAAKGKRAKDWALKLYWKGPEIAAHPLPKPAYSIAGLLEEVNRTIRVELTLRTPELKRLGLRKVSDWTAAKVREVWEQYVSKLDFGAGSVNLDTVELAGLGLKTRHQHAIAAWKAGNDLRAGMSRSAFYRLRAEIKDAIGYDIAASRPRSNVVPLRRVVALEPAGFPRWGEQLSVALGRAA